MNTNPEQVEAYRFGPYILDLRRGELKRGSASIRIQPQPFRVLGLLLGRAGDLVSREEIRSAIWESDTFVDFENGLNTCIRQIRTALRDEAARPNYIETVPKRGYRFIASVTVLNGTKADAPRTAGAVMPPPPEVVIRPSAGENELRAPEVVSTTPGRSVVASSSPDSESVMADPALAARPARGSSFRFIKQPRVIAVGIGVLAAALVLALFGVLAYQGRRHVWGARPIAVVRTTPMTTFSGMLANPQFSPDGRQVVFLWNGPDRGKAEVYIKTLVGGQPLRLTRTLSGFAKVPHWSVDGQNVIFSRCGGDQDGVFSVPALGGPEVKLAALHWCNWMSPDAVLTSGGSTLLFSDLCGDKGPPSIVVLFRASGERRCITNPPPLAVGDASLALSPDGKTVAFVRYLSAGVGDIYLVPLRGGKTRQLTFDHTWFMGVSWSSNGGRLLFGSQRGGPMQLWQMDASGGAVEAVAGVGTGSVFPALSADGKHLAYVQYGGAEPASIWEVALNRKGGVGTKKKLTGSPQGDTEARLSPDGTRLAFQSERSGSVEIWVSNRDGSDPVQMTSFGSSETGMPQWSPDGRKIACDARVKQYSQVFVIPVEGGPPQQLTDCHCDSSLPSWSHDGQALYFSSNRTGSWQLWKESAKGGAPQQITQNGAFDAYESADGKFVYYTKSDQPGLWRISLPGSVETKLLDDPPSGFWAYWAVSDPGIFYFRALQPHSEIWFLAFRDGTRKKVLALDAEPLPQTPLSASRDGHILLLQQFDWESVILLADLKQ